MDDCHQCVPRVTLDDHGAPCECGQTATCKRILCYTSCQEEPQPFVCALCVYATRTVTIGASSCVVRKWVCGFVIVTHVFSPTSSDTDVAPRLTWQMGEPMLCPRSSVESSGVGTSIATGGSLLLVPSIHAPSPRQVGNQELPPCLFTSL